MRPWPSGRTLSRIWRRRLALVVGQALGDAVGGAVGDEHDEATGQRHLLGEPGALVGDRVLGDLAQDPLAGLAGSARCLGSLPSPSKSSGSILHVAPVEHGVLRRADVDEGRLHTRAARSGPVPGRCCRGSGLTSSWAATRSARSGCDLRAPRSGWRRAAWTPPSGSGRPGGLCATVPRRRALEVVLVELHAGRRPSTNAHGLAGPACRLAAAVAAAASGRTCRRCPPPGRHRRDRRCWPRRCCGLAGRCRHWRPRRRHRCAAAGGDRAWLALVRRLRGSRRRLSGRRLGRRGRRPSASSDLRLRRRAWRPVGSPALRRCLGRQVSCRSRTCRTSWVPFS